MGELPDQIRIVHEGLILREVVKDDLPAMVDLLNDQETNQFFALADTVDLEVLEAFYDRATAARSEGRAVNLVVTSEDGQLLGQAYIGLPVGVLGGMIGRPVNR